MLSNAYGKTNCQVLCAPCCSERECIIILPHVSFSSPDVSCKGHFQNYFARSRSVGPKLLLMKINQYCPAEVNALTSSSKPCFPVLINGYIYKSSFAGSQ